MSGFCNKRLTCLPCRGILEHHQSEAVVFHVSDGPAERVKRVYRKGVLRDGLSDRQAADGLALLGPVALDANGS